MDEKLYGVSFTGSISMEDKINEVHELIKEICPDAVAIKIFVNAQGITFNPEYKTNLKDYGMRTITGEWVKKGE